MSTQTVRRLLRPFPDPAVRRSRRWAVAALTVLLAVGFAAAELPESPDSLPAVAEEEPR